MLRFSTSGVRGPWISGEKNMPRTTNAEQIEQAMET